MIFTALHEMQTRSSDKNSVCLSVRLSVKRMIFVTKRKKLRPRFYTTRKTIYSRLVTRRIVGGGEPFYLKFWVKLTRLPTLERNCRFSVDIRS